MTTSGAIQTRSAKWHVSSANNLNIHSYDIRRTAARRSCFFSYICAVFAIWADDVEPGIFMEMKRFSFRKRKMEDVGASEARVRISSNIERQQKESLPEGHGAGPDGKGESGAAGRRPSWMVSLVPFIVLIAVLVAVIRIFGADSLAGGSQVALLLASAVIVAIAMAGYKVSWQTLEDSVLDNIRSVGSAVLILLLIGAIAGTWMVSGVVPTLIYYGMKVITPGMFLAASCVISALVSVMTGSSWTTIATVGVALIGIGTAQGFDPGWSAGAIISGAYFGDKISPLSDTTVLASSASGTPLFTHIRYMLITTVPSMTITFLVFLVASLIHHSPEVSQVAEFSGTLKETFNISPWLLLVPLFTGFLIVRKVPAILTLFIAALVAGVTSLFAQPHIIHEVASGAQDAFSGTLSFRDAFKGLMMSVYGPTGISTGSPELDSLISTRGMTGMLNTIFLIICSVTFGGLLTGSGMLQSLTDMLTRSISGRTGIVTSTVGTGLFCNMTTGDQYLSIILTSSLYKRLYEQKGYEKRLLSRSVEDSATVTSVLIPWNSCGMTQSTVLKVPTADYLPYCIFNIISPLMSIAVALIGYRIYRSREKAR